MSDTYQSLGTFEVPAAAAGSPFKIARLAALTQRGFDIARLPYALRILLENLLRHEDGSSVTAADIEALANWDPEATPSTEIAFRPARVLMQDFTGVPAVVDLAAMRDAMRELGGDPARINPLQPVELVIDHSLQIDAYGSPEARRINTEREFERNGERYSFLKWGQSSFEGLKVVPPETGIVHQVNLEYLARVVMGMDGWAYPDTLVGTDSHTTMINGLGVLGWGVGGIEAEAAMLGQPVSMLVPQVVGVRLVGRLAEGTTATDLVLRVTEMLRAHGVVGRFVEFFGEGMRELRLADRATIANMAPEYGATCGLFPVDQVTLDYLRLSGRSDEQVALVEGYLREQGMLWEPGTPEARYTDVLELDISSVQPALAGPKRPQDRVLLSDLSRGFEQSRVEIRKATGRPEANKTVSVDRNGSSFDLHDGSVVIASITSCTNTSNPSVMIAAGLLAKKAVEKGLEVRPWVKTSLAPGSKVVSSYLEKAGLLSSLSQLGFDVVGYGCTTCIGNSGPLAEDIEKAIAEGGLVAAAVLSGNRNFEGRIHARVQANYLASPPLVVAYALAGDVNVDLSSEPLGRDADGQPVHLSDIWPSTQQIDAVIADAIGSDVFASNYEDVFTGGEAWRAIRVPAGDTYAWEDSSTYVRRPPYFEGMQSQPDAVQDIQAARVLAAFGDSITTDHISPAGAIAQDSPAGRYLVEHGVSPKDFNSYGSRRGNHEVMMRGTFANIRIKNRLVPGVEGGVTVHMPSGERTTIYDAAMRYVDDGVPTIVLAGKEYGTGSSRDWAAKGPKLQGVRAVIAQSFERIHRSNLVGMGILPLEFPAGQSMDSLGLDGTEIYDIEGLAARFDAGDPTGGTLQVRATRPDGNTIEFAAKVRIDTPEEANYYRHGGILSYVLRRLAS